MRETMREWLGGGFLLLQRFSKAILTPLMVLPFFIFAEALVNWCTTFSSAAPFVALYLPLIFAIGVAAEFAEDNVVHASIGAVAFFVIGVNESALLSGVSPVGAVHGIVAGICSAVICNKFRNMRVPSYLMFFEGPRFALFLTILVSIPVNILMWPVIGYFGMLGTESWHILRTHHAIGAFIYGVVNRLTLPIGLHHIVNNFVCFQMGDFEGSRGEFGRFVAGDDMSGFFMGGMFPIAMFGLPAAALAMFLTFERKKRKNVVCVFGYAIVLAVVTGITEPIECIFMYVSPFLYFAHAFLTGVSCYITSYFHVRAAFGFAAGFVDCFFGAAFTDNISVIYIVGCMMFVVYFFVFFLFIKLFKVELSESPTKRILRSLPTLTKRNEKDRRRAEQYMKALGGSGNLKELDACTTRLRLTVYDVSLVNNNAILETGALGVNRLGSNYVQIVIGDGVEGVLKAMNHIWEYDKI
ncbi:MAG: PTS transporter subunit EIIC [Oscillospiraceae bacterium]|jgi:PTS system N-acetylglucosamine-specific IIC component|nr:PTS transporter subunit EIIC [Oscillospiraceae bacterium]